MKFIDHSTITWPLALLFVAKLVTNVVASAGQTEHAHSMLHSNIEVISHLMWMHTPKTGSSFYATLQHDQCQDEWDRATTNATDIRGVTTYKGKASIEGIKCDVQTIGHGPLPLSIPSHRVVAVFRNPKSRIISSYADRIHHEGMSSEFWNSLKARINLAQKPCSNEPRGEQAACKFNNGLAVYAHDNATKGCVVRTMNGFWCMDESITPTPGMVNVAVERLHSFAFVGIFEEWDRMIEKFHHLRGHAERNVGDLELVHVRKGHYNQGDIKCMGDYSDPYDQAVYDSALEINWIQRRHRRKK